MPGTLHLAFVRSAHAHARLLSIDVGKARALPGVVAVVTGEDIREEIRPLPLPAVLPAFPARYPTFWPLAIDKVKFHGEPVAAVVAKDPMSPRTPPNWLRSNTSRSRQSWMRKLLLGATRRSCTRTGTTT